MSETTWQHPLKIVKETETKWGIFDAKNHFIVWASEDTARRIVSALEED